MRRGPLWGGALRRSQEKEKRNLFFWKEKTAPRLSGPTIFLNHAKRKDASIWEKGVDIGHVVTDAVGFAGAIGQAGWVPFLAPYANTMTGIGLVGDLASVTFHAMGYLTERGQVNLDSMDQIFSSKAAKRDAAKAAREAEEQQKQQPPTPPQA